MKLLGVQTFELCLKDLVRVIKAAKAESLAEQRKEARSKVCVCVCVKRVIVSRNDELYPHKMVANLNDKCFVCSECFTNWPFLIFLPLLGPLYPPRHIIIMKLGQLITLTKASKC